MNVISHIAFVSISKIEDFCPLLITNSSLLIGKLTNFPYLYRELYLYIVEHI